MRTCVADAIAPKDNPFYCASRFNLAVFHDIAWQLRVQSGEHLSVVQHVLRLGNLHVLPCGNAAVGAWLGAATQHARRIAPDNLSPPKRHAVGLPGHLMAQVGQAIKQV